MENTKTYRVSAAKLWRELTRLHEKTGGDVGKSYKRLPGLLRRLGLPRHEPLIGTLLEIAGEIEKTTTPCLVCNGAVVQITANTVGDVVAGAEDLLKHAAATDRTQNIGSRDLDETLREHSELSGEGE